MLATAAIILTGGIAIPVIAALALAGAAVSYKIYDNLKKQEKGELEINLEKKGNKIKELNTNNKSKITNPIKNPNEKLISQIKVYSSNNNVKPRKRKNLGGILITEALERGKKKIKVDQENKIKKSLTKAPENMIVKHQVPIGLISKKDQMEKFTKAQGKHKVSTDFLDKENHPSKRQKTEDIRKIEGTRKTKDTRKTVPKKGVSFSAGAKHKGYKDQIRERRLNQQLKKKKNGKSIPNRL